MRLRLLIFALAAWHCAASASAHHYRYTAVLTGPATLPSNTSTAIGQAIITLDVDEILMDVDASFSGLVGNVIAAHIHAPTFNPGIGNAAAATQTPSFAEFPSGVKSGDYAHEFDLAAASTYNSGFITSSGGTVGDAFNALYFALEAGKAYFDIHTSSYPGGEIRGFLSRVPGDYNDNSVVDAADYVVWRKTVNTTGEGLKADSNNDNVVNLVDYDAWQQNFGARGLSVSAGSGTTITAAIPEPNSAFLVALFLAAATTSARRNKPR